VGSGKNSFTSRSCLEGRGNGYRSFPIYGTNSALDTFITNRSPESKKKKQLFIFSLRSVVRKPRKSAAFRFTALNGTNHRKRIVKYLDTTYNLSASKRIYYQQNSYEKSIRKCAPTPSEKKIFDTLKELKAIYLFKSE
jgi:hypothetical protein